MTTCFKKVLVILPVCLLGVIYLYDHNMWYRQVSGKRLVFLALTIFLLYGWILWEVIRRKQKDFLQIGIQSGFYLYVFMVLTLTGFFILFREISANDWWDRMVIRIEKKDRVNFELFKIFKIYKISHTQIIGNFLMLFPLGIYLPLLYKRTATLIAVFFISMLASVLIEFLQLVTSYRSADVDDVILNTAGACAGFLLFVAIKAIYSKISAATNQSIHIAG